MMARFETSAGVPRSLQPPSRGGRGSLLQRKCACGGTPGADGECEECCEKRLQRRTATAQPANQANAIAPPIVHEVLRSPGQPLDSATRTFMEPRFGHDFSFVRVHTDNQAADSARAVNASAFTVGQSVVFDSGQYSTTTAKGRRLLAHELAHVIQQSGTPSARTSEQPEKEADHLASTVVGGGSVVVENFSPQFVMRQSSSSPDAEPRTDEVRGQKLSYLLQQITTETLNEMALRSELENLPPASSQRRDEVDHAITASRTTLIRLLELRIALLGEEVASLEVGVGPSPASSEDALPGTEEMGRQIILRRSELEQHRAQLQPLKRWLTRTEIQNIQTEVSEIDRELTAPPETSQPPEDQVSDPNDPRMRELVERRRQLTQRQRALAQSLSSSALRYRQGDPRWGSRRYGPSPECTNIAAAGCGPTALAILLNYLFMEDPELAAGGDLEFVTPPETSAYASPHGRVCNNGTSGDTMVTDVKTAWPGFAGARITLTQTELELRAGNLVIFLCKNCTGNKAAGGTYAYGGHFMVLSGGNDDASTFNVIEIGR